MLGKIFGAICIISTISAIVLGNFSSLGTAILDGTGAAVTLTLTLCGMMCLWNGLLEVFRAAGIIGKLAKILAPILRIFFPTAYRTGHGTEEITACVSANLLGIGNAATPLALAAMKEMNKDADPAGTATPDMISLALLNSAPLTLLPTSLIALRRAAGSSDPFSVVVPIWIASAASALFSLTLSRILAVPVLHKTKQQGKESRMSGTPNASKIQRPVLLSETNREKKSQDSPINRTNSGTFPPNRPSKETGTATVEVSRRKSHD